MPSAGAVGATLLFTNLENRRVLFISLATAVVGVAIAYSATPAAEGPHLAHVVWAWDRGDRASVSVSPRSSVTSTGPRPFGPRS